MALKCGRSSCTCSLLLCRTRMLHLSRGCTQQRGSVASSVVEGCKEIGYTPFERRLDISLISKALHSTEERRMISLPVVVGPRLHQPVFVLYSALRSLLRRKAAIRALFPTTRSPSPKSCNRRSDNRLPAKESPKSCPFSEDHHPGDHVASLKRRQLYIMVSQQRNNSFGSVGEVDTEVVSELRDRLTEISIKCSERCLYQSAKW